MHTEGYVDALGTLQIMKTILYFFQLSFKDPRYNVIDNVIDIPGDRAATPQMSVDMAAQVRVKQWLIVSDSSLV